MCAYKLTCPDCNRAYVGQTGRQFSIRYKEHKTAFRNNNQNNSFAKHLNDSAHSFGWPHGKYCDQLALFLCIHNFY
jgi:hypothetical protein